MRQDRVHPIDCRCRLHAPLWRGPMGGILITLRARLATFALFALIVFLLVMGLTR